MVEETIRTIRETERQAQKIVEDAQEERERGLAEAAGRGGQRREEVSGEGEAAGGGRPVRSPGGDGRAGW